MHASSNFVVILNGSRKDRVKANEYIQEYYCDDLYDETKIIFEETYEIVWLEDIVSLFEKIAEEVPKLNFAVSGFVDCSENSGEFMDFGIIKKGERLTTYSSAWLGYDDMDEDEDDLEHYSRDDRFMDAQELDEENIKEAFKEMVNMIKDQKWCDIT